jgi:hypothetical protein
MLNIRADPGAPDSSERIIPQVRLPLILRIQSPLHHTAAEAPLGVLFNWLLLVLTIAM